MKIDLTLTGDKVLLARLNQVEQKVLPRILAAANRAAIGVIAREAKQAVPVRSGLLRKSIGYVLRSYRGVKFAIAGPRRGWGRLVASRFDSFQGQRTFRRQGKMGKRRLKAQYQDPVKYAHWVERGHIVRFKKSGPIAAEVRPRRFMQTAFQQTKLVARAFWIAKVKQLLRMWGIK